MRNGILDIALIIFCYHSSGYVYLLQRVWNTIVIY